jgi:hypothetical protein
MKLFYFMCPRVKFRPSREVRINNTIQYTVFLSCTQHRVDVILVALAPPNNEVPVRSNGLVSPTAGMNLATKLTTTVESILCLTLVEP